MSYFQARSDLKFMRVFRQDVLDLWQIEITAAKNLTPGYRSKGEFQSELQVEATKIQGYQAVRERVAKKILRAARIGAKLRVPTIFTSYPAPRQLILDKGKDLNEFYQLAKREVT
jgi:hypothetical protein